MRVGTQHMREGTQHMRVGTQHNIHMNVVASEHVQMLSSLDSFLVLEIAPYIAN